MALKPVKRWLPMKAKSHISEARVWRRAARLHAEKAQKMSKDVVNYLKPVFENKPSRKVVHSSVAGAKKLLGSAAKEIDRVHMARENAREHIGAAKREVSRKNLDPRAARGRKYREGIL